MDMSCLPNLVDYATRRLADGLIEAEEQAKIEILLDERPPHEGISLYSGRLGPSRITDLDNWQDRHKNFTSKEIHLRVCRPPGLCRDQVFQSVGNLWEPVCYDRTIMTELSTANSFIIRIYRYDTDTQRKLTGLVEALDGR